MNQQQLDAAIDLWADRVFTPAVLPPEEIERAKAAAKKILEMPAMLICNSATECHDYGCWHRQPHERVADCDDPECGEVEHAVECVPFEKRGQDEQTT